MDNRETDQTTVKVPGEMALLAWALILGGVVVAIFVLKELLSAYLDVDGNSFVSELTRRFSDSTLIMLGDHPLIVTEQGAAIMAYFVFIPMSLLAIHVAVALIRAGAHILSPTFPYQISRLKQRIDSLKDQLDNK
jgi:hypothetical protein